MKRTDKGRRELIGNEGMVLLDMVRRLNRRSATFTLFAAVLFYFYKNHRLSGGLGFSLKLVLC